LINTTNGIVFAYISRVSVIGSSLSDVMHDRMTQLPLSVHRPPTRTVEISHTEDTHAIPTVAIPSVGIKLKQLGGPLPQGQHI